MKLFPIMFAIALTMLTPFTGMAKSTTIVDTYKFKMSLRVPRIVDNMTSQGYRKYQRQSIQGYLKIYYYEDGTTETKVVGLVNNTHKINGKKITYECYEYPYDDGYARVVALGSNRTLKFTQSGIRFSFTADPSYNIGGVEEDNTLMLELTGEGTLNRSQKYLCQIPNSLHGSVTGQIGCGCRAYGHISPTRSYYGYLTDYVIDIAPVHGIWTSRFYSRTIE